MRPNCARYPHCGCPEGQGIKCLWKYVDQNPFALQDDSPMPYGIHKGKPMQDVPAKYLLWLYENNKCNAAVKEYIEDNLDILNKETSEK